MIKALEKYIPKTINAFVGNDIVKDSLTYHLSDGFVGLITLYGSTGVGKSCLSKILAEDFSPNILYRFNGANLINELQQLVDCLDLDSPKTVVIDLAEQFSSDYWEVLDHYLGQENLRLILLYKRYEDINDFVKSRFNIYGLDRPTPLELEVYLNQVSLAESLEVPEDVIKEIVLTSKCLFPQAMKLLGECFILGVSDAITFNKIYKRDLEPYFSDLIYYLKDKNRVSKILEYLLTRYTSKDIYHLFSEYCIHFFQEGSNACAQKLGNRLLAYSKEMTRLAHKSNGVTDLYCDIYLLEAYIANSSDYKSMIDLAVILPETDREKRQAHLIKNVVKPNDTGTQISKTSKTPEKAVNYLSASDLIKRIGAITPVEEG